MLDQRVAWIIGATGTIGAAVARTLKRSGADVVVSARGGDSLAAIAAELGTESMAVDLADRASVDAAAARLLRSRGRIDILVNSAALPLFGDPLELDDDVWLAVLQAKGLGYMRSIRAVLPGMLARKSGAIVNVSGRGGHQPTAPSHLPGCAANAMVDLLTRGFANLYGQHGIRITAVAPGPIASARFDQIAAANSRVAAQAPAGRVGTAEDVAAVVRFLVSDEARHLNGVILQVDGGTTATL